MTYVIHGATGAQGAPVVAALAAAAKPVTALTRNPDAVVDGARVVAADHSSTEELTAAYRGADAVFIHLPVVSEEDRRTHAHHIVAAVRAARPARVVFSTSGAPIDAGTGGAAAILAGGLADAGVSHAVIAPTFYLENLLMPYVVDAVRERGVLTPPSPCSTARTSPAWSLSASTRRSPDRTLPRRSAPTSARGCSSNRSPQSSSAALSRP
ncbi:NAD(P)H-binding protein [Streptomyces bobili]|uniref:NAD(P)H-binding protein n=1 Tax=Streptomyces bobili TaxID=67280 RepID=UPI00342CEA87